MAETSARTSTVMLSPNAFVKVDSSSPRMFSFNCGNYLCTTMVAVVAMVTVVDVVGSKQKEETDGGDLVI